MQAATSMSKIATIGFFDGVHLGHRYLFDQLRKLAQMRGLAPMIITFRQHPRAVLYPSFQPELITPTDERIALIEASSGITPEVIDFASIHTLTAAAFMHKLHQDEQVTALLMGYDHRFGSDQLRTQEQYRCVGIKEGIDVLTLNEYTDASQHISSTEIRHALIQGDIHQANALLGRPYSLSGYIEHGNAIGRTIGFPTANIHPDEHLQLIPLSGVYQVQVLLPCSEQPLKGILNIGTNPTVGNTRETIELHILDWAGDLYGQHLTVLFERRIREERSFGSLDDLRRQISEDIKIFHT